MNGEELSANNNRCEEQHGNARTRKRTKLKEFTGGNHGRKETFERFVAITRTEQTAGSKIQMERRRDFSDETAVKIRKLKESLGRGA